jgi:hypothetical protein
VTKQQKGVADKVQDLSAQKLHDTSINSQNVVLQVCICALHVVVNVFSDEARSDFVQLRSEFNI